MTGHGQGGQLEQQPSVVNNANQTPAQLAGSCGFEECAHFLEAAAQHQQAQELGQRLAVAAQTEPVAVSKDVSPCVINYGANGGKLPPPASQSQSQSHIPNGHAEQDVDSHAAQTECEMEEEDSPSQGDVAHTLPGMQHGHAHLTNGHVAQHSDHHHHAVINGHHLVPHGDITVHHGISANQVPVAGCKRTREDMEEIECKRVRRNDPDHGACPQDGFLAGDFVHHVRHPPDLLTRESSPIPPTHCGMDSFTCPGEQSPLPDNVRSTLLQLVPDHVAKGVVAYVQDALTSSAVEHHHSVMLEQGYDSMFCEAMALSTLPHT